MTTLVQPANLEHQAISDEPRVSPVEKLTSLLEAHGSKGLFAALAIVFLWFGGMKFTTYEAEAIAGLVANSPFVSWLQAIFPNRTVAGVIGSVELGIAALLALRFVSPRLGAIGAAGASLTFLLTFSFFFTTPGVFLEDVSGPAISVLPGQFLLKDLVLFAASVAALGEALKALRDQPRD